MSAVTDIFAFLVHTGERPCGTDLSMNFIDEMLRIFLALYSQGNDPAAQSLFGLKLTVHIHLPHSFSICFNKLEDLNLKPHNKTGGVQNQLIPGAKRCRF